jgi:DNA-binding winged helix-turn-helix (wHTH) protein/Tol biopolymer transport system component
MPSELRFGDYRLDVQRHTLRRGGSDVAIGERAFAVLRLLVENAGRVVTRQELIDEVWRDVIVSDDSLARAVSDLRAALQDDASHARYIRTIHRQGYLFVAPVRAGEESAEVARAEPPAARRRPSRPVLLLVLSLVVVVSVVAVREMMRATDREPGPAQTELADWSLRALGPHPFAATAIKPAFAKSDHLLAVVAPDPGTDEHSLFLLRAEGGEPLQMTRGVEVRGPSPEFTADDSHILFTVYRSDPELGRVPDVWQVPVPAGKPALLVRNASAASSSPDGEGLVYAAVRPGGTSIRVRRRDGAEVEVAARGFWPRWSPDGRWIAYTTSDPEGGDGTIHVVRPDGGEDRELTEIASQVYGLCWAPDSSRVIFASEQSGPTMLWSVEVESGEQRSVTRGPGECTSPTMAPDGERLVFNFSHRRWYLYLAGEPGEEARRLLVEPGLQAAALSPAGDRIALALGTEARSPAVIVLDVETLERRTLSGMAASALAWMPDARSLLVAAPAPDGVSHWIWRLPLDGGLPEPLLKGAGHWDFPSASPDGATLAAVRRGEAGSELVLHDIEGGHRRALAAKTTILAPRWSPNGELVAWSGGWRPDEVGSGGVWVCPAAGGSPRRLSADGAWPVWEPGGEHLLYARFIENRGIWRVPLTAAAPRLARDLGGELQDLYLQGLDLGPGGGPMLLFMYEYTGALYALEPPKR